MMMGFSIYGVAVNDGSDSMVYHLREEPANKLSERPR